MRIQGIKTNISFLINVVNNPTFQAGACYTTFIEETPELFDLTQRTDRASKILDFLGDKIVNVSKGEKPISRTASCPSTTRPPGLRRQGRV